MSQVEESRSVAPEPELHPESLEGKNVVIGIGNPYMRDDAVGIHIVNELRKNDLGKDVYVYDYRAMDLSLLSYFQKAARVIIADALKSGKAPGTVSKYIVKTRDSPLLNLPNLHELQLFDIMDLASQTGVLPYPFVVVGVEPEDVTAGEGMTQKVAAAVHAAVLEIMKELKKD